MLKVFESFDHLGMLDDGTDSNRTSYLWNLGWQFGSWAWNSAWGDCNPLILSGRGRFGTKALGLNDNAIVHLPTVQRLCNTLVVGICVGENVYEQWRTGQQYVGPPALDVHFVYNDGATPQVMHLNFRVHLVFNLNGTITVTCFTGLDNGTTVQDYPTILTPEYIPTPYYCTAFTFIEVYLNLTDFMDGRVKVAVNGQTYVNKSGIVGAAYKVFGSDPYDPRAKINHVSILSRNTFLFDTVYLCDDAGGYQNDFLGNVFMKTCYPTGDAGRSEWMAVENGTVVDAPGAHHEFVDDDIVYPGNEATYLQADQDLSAEIMSFALDPVPPGETLIAVNSRTMFRNVASPGAPKFNSIVPLYQIQGNPVIQTDSLTKRVQGWAYAFLDVYYPLVPGFATPWAEYLLEQSTFGFLLRTAENMQMVLEEVMWEDLIDTQHDWDELIQDGLNLVEDIADSELDIAAWDVAIEDEFDSTEEPDYGDFLLDDGIDFVEDFALLAGGMADIIGDGTLSTNTAWGAPYGAAAVVDGDVDTAWVGTRSGDPYYWWFQSDIYARSVDPPPMAYSLISKNLQDVGSFRIISWRLEGKMTGGAWVVLDEQIDHAFSADRMFFPLTDPVRYQSYRLYITKTEGSQYYAVVQDFQVLVHWVDEE
jgi:hypothetical protein